MDGAFSPMPDTHLAVTQWFVAVTAPRAERIAKEQLSKIGVSSFLPLRERPPTPEQPLIVEPIFPGYLFVAAEELIGQLRHHPPALDGEGFIPRETFALRRLLCNEGDPVVMPRRCIEKWLLRADPDGLVDRYRAPEIRLLRKDDVVQIRSGAYVNMFGVVEWARGEKLKIVVTCFNRPTDVYLRAEQVTLADAA